MEFEKNGVREKSFLGVLVFGHPYCSSINSTHFNVEHENKCSCPCHIGTYMQLCKKKLLKCFV